MKVSNTRNRQKCKIDKGKALARKCKINLPADYPWLVLNAFVKDHEHALTTDEHALITQIIRDRDFHAYLQLEDIWGLQNTVSITLGELDLNASRVKLQVCSLLKKYRFPTEQETRIAAAKQKFINAEADCYLYNQSGYEKLIWGKSEYEAETYSYAKAFLQKVLGEKLPPFAHLSEWSRHGPGSNLDTCKGLTSQYHKYLRWPYSCTQSAIPFARLLIESDKRWLGALEDSYRDTFNISKVSILNREVFWETVLKPVDGNEVFFVPKNALTERTCAKEPAMNLMLQLGVDGFIRRRLKRWDVDLDDQTKNQRYAGLGSTDNSKNGFVTLDLSAASDSISLALCKWLLPPDWYDYLVKIRSPRWKMDGEEGGVYAKISSMGNGYTFALESAIFAAVIYAVMRAERGVIDTKSFAVYGDDLIVQKKYAQGVIDLLSRCGFKLNFDKSFQQGWTRESCGSDWLHGYPVRPVFLVKLPENVKELMSDRNRLLRSENLFFDNKAPLVVDKIDSWLPELIKENRFYGPYSDEEFDTYLHSPTGKKWVGQSEKPWETRGTNFGAWVFTRLVYRPVELNADNFLFRKLMHDLRGVTIPVNPWQKKVASGGNRFTVSDSKIEAVGTISRHTDIWCDEYSHLVTWRG
jgi:Holliday junction resolvase-like predicted endonuclease